MRWLSGGYAGPSLALVVVGVFGLIGFSKDGTPPDPNDVRSPGADVLGIYEREFRALYWMTQTRASRGEITPEQGEAIFTREARRRLKIVRLESLPDAVVFRWAELFRGAKLWPTAEVLFRRALTKPESEDRWVNDKLRLAHVVAEQGRAHEAASLVRQTFRAQPGNKPPILLAVYLEISPAIASSRLTVAADLISEAMEQHAQAEVVATSDSGRQFLLVRPTHLHRAGQLAERLYVQAGYRDRAEQVRERTWYLVLLTRGLRAGPGRV